MAHVVGVPKRDPCHNCALPVFLAERLTIGKRVYHRTCLKCARCSSQLTPGSFYETEIDGEYCCETCPDEEKSISDLGVGISVEDDEKSTSTASAATRGSIADRLAFFENDGKKLLQKSLSDEEKSQSLKKITETQMKNVYKQNSALSHFMSNHLLDTTDSVTKEPGRSTESSRRNSASTTTSATSDVDDEVSEDHSVPDLPKSLPPSITASTIDASAGSSSSGNIHKPKSYESTLALSFENVNNRSLDTSTPIAREPTVQVASDYVEQINKTTATEQKEAIKPSTLSTEKSTTDLNQIDKKNVTKDISDTDEQMRTTTIKTKITTTGTASPTPNLTTENVTTTSDKFDEISQNNRSSMVRARLHQFEIISNNNSPPSSSSSNSSSSKAIISVSNEKLSSASIVADRKNEPKPLETEVPKIVTKDIDEHNDVSFKDNDNVINEVEDASYKQKDEKEEESTKHQGINEESLQTQENAEETVESKETTKSMPDRIATNANLDEEYPEDLNPFKSDEESEDGEQNEEAIVRQKDDDDADKLRKIENRKSLNPFDSSDDENQEAGGLSKKIKPPRPPPPKISKNPFGSDEDEDDESFIETPKKVPVPTPRSHVTTSQNSTPEPTPRLSRQQYGTPLQNSDGYYGSHSSLTTPSHGLHASTEFLKRDTDARGSSHSIGSSTGSLSGGKYKKTKKAPAPPKPAHSTIKELFPPAQQSEPDVSPASSTASTPLPRKKRPAPAPPTSAEKMAEPTPNRTPLIPNPSETDDVKVSEDKLSDEEKLKDATVAAASELSYESDNKSTRRLITVDASLLEDTFSSVESRPKEEDSVVYRRTIAPLVLDTSIEEDKVIESHNRQLEKLKDNKEAKNRNRQSQISLPSPNEENDPLFNKSVHGKWKRRKGPAPALPVPPKKVLQMLPLQEIRHELEIIEVQQQGLEKQGVMLEKMIRERCEGDVADEFKEDTSSNHPAINSKEVEDLILQLFELVNEKNELFRRQAELMYLRRQHRLEQEQADLEYEIRVLMAQPERNKTDSDKAREETMIARLVEVVQLRNEVIDCLEMDRLREAEEDMSIKQRLELHTAQRDEELSKQTPTKLSKKEKKRQKESKKLGKSKKLDADKDADESELSVEKKEKKKKKNLLGSVIAFK